MTVFPQVLINVDVKSKPRLESLSEVMAIIRRVEKELNGRGRVLVRYSGTQPQCRVMVEGPTVKEAQYNCDRIAVAVKKMIGM